MNINQEQVDKHVANTKEYWDSFLSSLQAPYSFWKNCKNNTLQQWVDAVWKTPYILKGINNLSEFPILKGEALLVCNTKSQLTNYRLIYSQSGVLLNIPLHNMTYYDVQTDAGDKGNDLIIKYSKSGEDKVLRIDEWLEDEVVAAVRDAGEFKKLSDIQKQILELSHYELTKLGINAPKIGMLEKTPEKGCFER